MIRPAKADFLQMAKPDHIIAVIKEISSDVITPVDAYYALNAAYLLESAEKGLYIGRYSFLGVETDTRIEISDENCRITTPEDVKDFKSKDPLRLVGTTLKSKTYLGEGDISYFPGGAVGYIGYDMVRRWEDIPVTSPGAGNPGKEDLGLPDALFIITRYTIVFDNLMHTLKIICNVSVGDDPDADYINAISGIEEIEKKLQDAEPVKPLKTINNSPVLKSKFPKQSFMDSVEKIRELITKGDAIQVVISQRIETDYEGDPFEVYRALRSINPSPYMFYFNFGDFSMFGASPELMIKVEDGRAVLRPIAGTRPRGKTLNEDEVLKADLLSDAKEKAEHLMLVDLARNDLGRIAKPGSVSLDRMMDVELYSHVMHIVSEVSADLEESMDVFDVIKAVFPAGTVSGAPKVRAMEIIEEMEPVRRGPYAGLFGYLSYTGRFDSGITIRSVVAANDKLHLQAGAGIVYDSEPEKEYQETINKAKALFSALMGRKI